MNANQHRGRLTGLLVATAALSFSFGGWALADYDDGHYTTPVQRLIARAAEAARDAAEERLEADRAVQVGAPDAAEEVAEAEKAEREAAEAQARAEAAQAAQNQATQNQSSQAPAQQQATKVQQQATKVQQAPAQQQAPKVQQQAPVQQPQTQVQPSNQLPAGGTLYGDDIYKVEGGVTYEWDDGRWEAEYDKKIEGGVVYDYDDGRWEIDD